MGAGTESETLRGEQTRPAPGAVVVLSDTGFAQQLAGWLAAEGMAARVECGDGRATASLDRAVLLVIDRLITDGSMLGTLGGVRERWPALRILAVGDRVARDAWELGRLRNAGATAHRVLPGRPSREVFTQAVRELV